MSRCRITELVGPVYSSRSSLGIQPTLSIPRQTRHSTLGSLQKGATIPTPHHVSRPCLRGGGSQAHCVQLLRLRWLSVYQEVDYWVLPFHCQWMRQLESEKVAHGCYIIHRGRVMGGLRGDSRFYLVAKASIQLWLPSNRNNCVELR